MLSCLGVILVLVVIGGLLATYPPAGIALIVLLVLVAIIKAAAR